jgi:hypothetical protein
MFVDNSSDTTCINKWVVSTNPHDSVALIIGKSRHESVEYIIRGATHDVDTQATTLGNDLVVKRFKCRRHDYSVNRVTLTNSGYHPFQQRMLAKDCKHLSWEAV